MNEDIIKAANIIKTGGLVAFPTETVYGLGADAGNQAACLKIFQAKERPANNPLIVHVSSVEDARQIVEFNEDAEKLSKLWPGPLTLVLPKKKDAFIAECVTAGLGTVAIRIPASSVALGLITASQRPIAAPSANKSGTLSSTNYDHVRKNFGSEIFVLNSDDNNIPLLFRELNSKIRSEHRNVDNYLRSGAFFILEKQFLKEDRYICGLESTIIDLTSHTPTILRFGFITPDTLEELLGKKIEIASELSEIKAPGMSLKHYAPKTKLRLNAKTLGSSEVGLNFGSSQLDGFGSMNLSHSANMTEAASNLFEYLHVLDELCQKNKIGYIAVAPIPDIGIGLAINDRLKRAAKVYNHNSV